MEFLNMTGAEKLSESIKVKTISNKDSSVTDWSEFTKLLGLLEKLFPMVYQKLEVHIINGYSLVYCWKGRSKEKKPVLFTSHTDVVPVEMGTENDWEYGAFSGDMANGSVWGRGTLDIKIQVISILEAAERLLRDGFLPERDIYFAFGHDEEVGGLDGALKIVEYFKENGINFEYMIDEGGCVSEGIIGDVKVPIALIGVGEKGYADIKLTVSGEGGHSSTPPANSALGLLAQVICRIEKEQPRPRLINPVRDFLMAITPKMGWLNRLILNNLWLFKPIFMSVFTKTKTGNALLRTTTAVTMAQASNAPNVLPQRATAVANFRLLQGESGEDLLKHIRKVCRGIPIELEALTLDEPSIISPSNSVGYKTIEKEIKKLYADAVIAPYIVLGGTDARKYEPVCSNIYRFSPYKIHNRELDKMHGTNESISFENIERCITFFYDIMKEA
jgi:Acetylornithine deacetylase/Succinyl-diaminopimelate desuccinylase and related deacylases